MGGGRRLRKVIAISRRSANLAVPDVCSEQTNIPPTCDGASVYGCPANPERRNRPKCTYLSSTRLPPENHKDAYVCLHYDGGTRMVMFSTTYSESAYPSS